jgi:hypothetical protein
VTGKRAQAALVALCGLAAVTAGVALAAYNLPPLQALWLQGTFLCH